MNRFAALAAVATFVATGAAVTAVIATGPADANPATVQAGYFMRARAD